MKTTRRTFLATVAASVGAAAFSSAQDAPRIAAPLSFRHKICGFEKPLQHLSYAQLADFLADAGLDGVEATVRKNGHIVPEKVEEELPKFVAALKKRNIETTLITTEVNGVAPEHEKVLRTAAKLGIQRYRTGKWTYDLKKPVLEQLEALRPQVKELAAMNRQIGITGLYQNHAGANVVGAGIWDLHSLLRDIDPKHLGMAFDIRHATVDGASVWPVQFNLMRPHIGIVYVKDFEWQGRKAVNVPLGKGQVDPAFFKQVLNSGFTGPISLHIEYPVENSQLAEVFKRDLATLRGWLQGRVKE